MKTLLILALLVGGIGAWWARTNLMISSPHTLSTYTVVDASLLAAESGYIAVDPDLFDVSIVTAGLVSPTRLRISPGGDTLFVTQITGEVLAFRRTQGGWNETPEKVISIDTKFPGFPPDEAGLVSLIFSYKFQEDHTAFLLYTYKDQDGTTQNRVSRFTLWNMFGRFIATKPELIYQANIPGTGSHQITDGVSLDVGGKPHLLFAIGEGFQGTRAQNPNEEGGKLILIQHDGSNPLGNRPFPENPKVQALGVRNAYVVVDNPYDPKKRIFIADTGPDHYDRILYANPLKEEPLNFKWDGTEESLANPIPDPNDDTVSDMAIVKLPETRTIAGLAIHPGKGTILASTEEAQLVLATVFGKTGWQSNEPGKEIWLGKLTNLNGQPKISFEPIIKRNPDAEGKFGNPIGLAIDPLTGDFFFADIMEGRIYKVSIPGTQ